jgi:hypothetical protein
LILGAGQLLGDAVEDIGEGRVTGVEKHHADDVRALRRPRAAADGRYPNCSTASRRRLRICGLVPDGLRITFDPAVVDTPACLATSTTVTRRWGAPASGISSPRFEKRYTVSEVSALLINAAGQGRGPRAGPPSAFGRTFLLTVFGIGS